jgi:formylglycine-generating enzyme required for sulfatase activity
MPRRRASLSQNQKLTFVIALLAILVTIFAAFVSGHDWFSPAPLANETNAAILTLTPTVSSITKTITPAVTPTFTLLTAINSPLGITPTELTPSPEGSTSLAEAPDHIDAFGLPMRLVPAGSFMMGSDADAAVVQCEQFGIDCEREWFINEEPVHEVYLDAYYIDKYEVTNKFYKACVDASACRPPIQSRSFAQEDYYGNSIFDDFPVVFVNWDMAETYCEWRGAKLPTEAQWEKAARGNDGRIFPWGNEIDYKYANFDQIIRDTTMVSQYEKGKSPYGVYDLAGNTLEWVYDWYSETYYQISSSSNPIGPDQGDGRAVRGGSWFDKDQIRSAWREGWEPFNNADGLGFRCAMNVVP